MGYLNKVWKCNSKELTVRVRYNTGTKAASQKGWKYPQRKRDSLFPHESRILVRRIAKHPIIHHIPRVRNRIAPKRLLLDPKILDRRARHIAQRQADWATIPILARARRVVAPPRLAVPVDAACAMRVDGEVAPGEDEPGGLVLDEDDAVGVGCVEPVLDVGLELEWAARVGMNARLSREKERTLREPCRSTWEETRSQVIFLGRVRILCVEERGRDLPGDVVFSGFEYGMSTMSAVGYCSLDLSTLRAVPSLTLRECSPGRYHPARLQVVSHGMSYPHQEMQWREPPETLPQV